MRLIVIMLTSFVTANKRPAVSRALALPRFGCRSHFPQESAWQDEPLVRVQDMPDPCGRYQSIRMPELRQNAGAWDVWRLSRAEAADSGAQLWFPIDSDCTWHYDQYDQQVSRRMNMSHFYTQLTLGALEISTVPAALPGDIRWHFVWHFVVFFVTFFSRRWKLTGSSTAGLLVDGDQETEGNFWEQTH